MAFSKAVKSKYSSYITKKIFYIKILNKIKIVKLFKKPLSIVYRGKKYIISQNLKD